MSNLPQLKDLMDWFKKPKNKDLSKFLVIFILGFLLLSFGRYFTPKKTEPEKDLEEPLQLQSNLKSIETSYEDKLEEQLEELLKQIAGVGDVSIMLNFESEVVSEPAFNTVSSEKNTKEEDNQGGLRTVTEKQTNTQVVMVKKGGTEEPMIVKKASPKINGVLIVAQGAHSSEITDKITKATATLLDIPLYKIRVLAK